MNKISDYNSDSRTVVAISQDDANLRAAVLRKQNGSIEVVLTRSADASQVSWPSFAAELIEQAGGEHNVSVVAGFNCSGVVFYRLDIPTVSDGELATIVKMQAEAKMPLSADQIEIAWRADKPLNGSIAVTVAAARKDSLRKFVENVRWFNPEKIVLDCQAVVQAWKKFFIPDQTPGNGIVVSIGPRNTQACLVRGGKLANRAILDVGMNDFLDTRADIAGRFALDMKNALTMFGFEQPNEIPVYMLSDGGDTIQNVADALCSAGVNAVVLSPQTNKLTTPLTLNAGNIYEYRVPIAMAAMILDDDAAEFNIFNSIYQPAGTEKKKTWIQSLKVTAAAAALTAVALMAVFYTLDVAALNSMEKLLNTPISGTTPAMLIEKQRIIKAVIPQRLEMLELLGEIIPQGSEGILLDNFEFRPGRPVMISGQAQSDEQLYKFHKNLQAQKSLAEVNIQSAKKDPKEGKINFTIAFHYKGFTKKKNQPLI